MAKMTGGKAAKASALAKKAQTTALLPKQKIKGAMAGSSPKARIAKMEKMDPSC